MNKMLFWLILGLYLLADLPARAQNWPEKGSLIPNIAGFVDPARSYTIEKVIESAQFTQGLSIIGFQNADFWVQFSLHNPESTPQTVIFEDQWSITDNIDIYIVKGSDIKSHPPIGHKAIDPGFRQFHIFPYIPLSIDPGLNTIYVRYRTNDIVGSRIEIWNPSVFEAYKMRVSLIFGLLLGAILVMSFYNFFIFLSVRNKAYLYYAFYSFSFFAFQFVFSGIFAQITGFYQYGLDGPSVFFAGVAMIGIILFSSSFLNLPQISSKAYRTGQIIILLILIASALIPIHFRLANLAIVTINFIVSGWCIIAGTIAIRKKIPEGKFYLFAWMFFILGNLYSVFSYVGIIERNALNRWGMIGGSTVEVVLLSFGLAQYIHRLKQEALAAQEQKIAIEQDLRFESDSKFLLASELAHRINNPLNYIQTGIDSISDPLDQLRQKIFALFDEQNSPEALELKASLGNDLKETAAGLSLVKTGLERTSSQIKELRSVSGIDGYPIENIRLKLLIDSILHRCQEVFTASELSRLQIIQSIDSIFPSNLALLKNSLVLFLQELIRSSKGTIQLNFYGGDSGFRIEIKLTLDSDSKDRLVRMERQLGRLLQLAGARIFIEESADGFHLRFTG